MRIPKEPSVCRNDRFGCSVAEMGVRLTQRGNIIPRNYYRSIRSIVIRCILLVSSVCLRPFPTRNIHGIMRGTHTNPPLHHHNKSYSGELPGSIATSSWLVVLHGTFGEHIRNCVFSPVRVCVFSIRPFARSHFLSRITTSSALTISRTTCCG